MNNFLHIPKLPFAVDHSKRRQRDSRVFRVQYEQFTVDL